MLSYGAELIEFCYKTLYVNQTILCLFNNIWTEVEDLFRVQLEFKHQVDCATDRSKPMVLMLFIFVWLL